MSYLGNTPTTQSFISGTDYFNGDGSTTAFTLSRTVNSVNDIEVFVNNVAQRPNDAYTISGTTLTFTGAPSAGTQNIYVRYLSTTTQTITPSQNTVSYASWNSDLQSETWAFRNRIINGAMVIDQRNAGASVTLNSGTTYTLDRWFYFANGVNRFTVQRNAGSVTPPAGFTNYLGYTVASSVSIGAGDYYLTAQRIEGFNVADLNWGTSNAQPITISFWVRSSLTGTFGASVQNGASNRSYPFTYTISSANTWEYKTVTIAGDTSGTWATDNTGSLTLWFGLGVGSSLSGTAGSWSGSDFRSATGATSVVGTNGATFYITGVQLEKGSTATSFDYRPYGTELALCQRYYFKSLSSSSNAYLSNFGSTVNSTTARFATAVPVEMRATPTVGYSNVGIDKHTASYSISNLAIFGGISKTVVGLAATSSGMTGDQPVVLFSNSGATGYIDYSAEL